MHGCLRNAAVAAVAVVCSLAPLPAAGQARGRAHAGVPAPLGGVNVAGLSPDAHLAEADQSIALARQLHAKVVRTELSWSLLEPLAANQLDPKALAWVDRLVGDAAGAGIKVIATVRSTPCWDSLAPASLLAKCVPTRLTPANAWPPRDPSAYAAITSFLARRYGGRLAAIEVWNEPDQANELYFAGASKPQRYAAILRAAYPAIKQAAPGLPVLAGSLVGSNGAFLRALYSAGIKGFYDGLAVHYYNLTLGSVRAIHETQRANGDSKPLWLDEFGWTSCWPRERVQEEQACVTPGVQAHNIANIFRSLARTSYVAAELIFQLDDKAHESFGVVTDSGAHKPAFSALSGVLVNPFGPPSRVTLRLRRHGGRVIASGSGPVGDYMGLEAFRRGALRYRALFTLDRFNRYTLRLPRALGTSGLSVRVFQYWAGVGQGAHRRI